MIPFTKAHACGNDFLIVAEEAVHDCDRAELTRELCERNTGIGADGIEFFSWTGPKSGRIHLRNADGSIAEISGNGTRCVAAWMAAVTGATGGDALEIETDAGLRVCRIDSVNAEGDFTLTSAGTGSCAAAATKSPYPPRRPDDVCVMTPSFTASSAAATFHCLAAADTSITRAVAAAFRIWLQASAVAELPPVPWTANPFFAST